MKTRAEAKYVRISPRKVRAVCDRVRGKSVDEAKAILRYTPNKAAFALLKVLNSAVANAQNNHELMAEDLFVEEIYANQGPRMKRWKAGARGQAKPRLHRTSHLGVVVSERE